MAIALRDEKEWARLYPAPQHTEEDMLLSLWNYPVTRTDLVPAHREALKKFLAGDFQHVKMARWTETVIYVTGHASDSGEAASNDSLSRQRARKVVQFLVSEGFPESQIRESGVGATEPATSGSSGYSASRNRRVDVLRVLPTVEEVLPPIGPGPRPPDPEPQPDWKVPRGALPSSLTVDLPLDIPLPPIQTAEVIVGGKIGGVLKVKVDDKGGGWGGGLAINNGKLTAKFEQKILDDLKGKVSFEAPSAGSGAMLKAGGEFRIGKMDTTLGLQTKLPNFVYCEFSFEAFRLPDIELGDVHVSMTLKPTLKIEAGPGPAMLARAGVTAGTAASVAAGTLLLTALFVAGAAKVVDNAKQEGLSFARVLARRAGVAARVAYEVAGAQAATDFKEEQLKWTRTLDRMGPSFAEGVELVDARLRHGKREALREEWATRYAGGSQVFVDIYSRVLEAVGNLEKGDESEDPSARL